MLKSMVHPMRRRVAYVGTYPPQECGIATFTMDVLNATGMAGWLGYVVAVNDSSLGTVYTDKEVIATIDKEVMPDYAGAVKMLADRGVSLVCIQHEFGIYGGDNGEHVVKLARAAVMPVVVTLHTVLPEPSAGQRRVIRDLEKYTDGFVVMALKAIEILTGVYGIDRRKIHYIPHGAPIAPYDSDKTAKARYGFQGRRVLSTFGLISPNKGIEDAIAAMPAIVAQEPSALYLVLGQTHPIVKRREGERYRERLVKQVKDLGLTQNVEFVDRYLSLQHLVDYLLATDVYISPYYANPHQITSGTLAYAMAAGKAIVSTPYLYAEEILANQRGFLYPFRDVEALSSVVARLLTDHALFMATRQRAYEYGRAMTWPNVGMQYAKLFADISQTKSAHDNAVVDAMPTLAASDVKAVDSTWIGAAAA